MPFTETERNALLAVKGVGETVIQRFEEIGIESLSELAEYTPEAIAEQVANLLGSTCWKNSPQARTAIGAAITLAREKDHI